MCGIAGFSRGNDSRIDPQQAARVLLASVAERGADAAGCAWQQACGTVVVDKQPGGASAFLESMRVPNDLRQLMLHVRDHTKGRPSLPANNHPIRHGAVVGVHNGRIENDDAIFAALGRERFELGMTVDSEAIFAVLDESGSDLTSPAVPAALERLRGALATTWFDERTPGSVFLARGVGRPLWMAETASGNDLLWASTLEALEIVEEFLGIDLLRRPVRSGTVLEVRAGRVVREVSYLPDRTARWLLHPATSPEERVVCLDRLGVAARTA